jgi:transcriptional regulator with XRE-family HTH domain/quercetin dioxygenase-like cupin family protein
VTQAPVTPPVPESEGGPVDNLGARLRDVRLKSGMSLREVARQLGVSPSFISQMENGKSQPSVATLYSMAQLLGVSIDDLFNPGSAGRGEAQIVDPVHAPVVPPRYEGESAPPAGETVSRSDFSSPAEAWGKAGLAERIQILQPADRPRLVMDSGVIWEQLAANHDHNLDFMEIVYPPGSSSTNDSRMLRHAGMEYGYLLTGELQITYGFDVFTLRAGESMCLDPQVPHLLTNTGPAPARGIWAVHHCAHDHSG